MNFPTQFRALFIVCTLLLAAGCAKPRPPIYYPDAPAPPRIQFLTAFNSEANFLGTSITAFIAGDVGYGLGRAMAIDTHGSKVYVLDGDKKAPGYAVFDLASRKVKPFFPPNLKAPLDLKVDSDGTIFISDRKENRIAVFDRDNKFVTTFKSDAEGFTPAGLAIVGDRLYVASLRENLIRVFDKNTRTELFSFGENDKLGWPLGLAVTPDNQLVVSETGSGYVSLFTLDGVFVTRFGGAGLEPGKFARPKSLDVDRNGNIHVIDVAFYNVQIFNPDLAPLMWYPTENSSSEDNLELPISIHISYDNFEYFQKYVAPEFKIEYLIFIGNQGFPFKTAPKVSVFAFGKSTQANYEN